MTCCIVVARSAPAGAAATEKTEAGDRADQKNARSSWMRVRVDGCFLWTLKCSIAIGECRWPLGLSRAADDVLFTPKQWDGNATEGAAEPAQWFLYKTRKLRRALQKLYNVCIVCCRSISSPGRQLDRLMQLSTRATAAARTVVRSATRSKVKYIKRKISGTKTASLREGEPQCRALLWEKAGGVYVG